MVEVKSILFVDDERSVLRALRRTFMNSGYKLYFADSGELGLKILAAGRIDLVLSDMRMPEMDGYEFLRRVRELYPRVIRLILSGFVEESYVYKALIDGSAKTYLAKPWHTGELLSLVAGLVETEEILGSKRLLAVLNTVTSLPMMPEIYHQVMALIDADADFDKIVAVIEKDPAITAKVLQVANSAFFKSGTASLKRAAVFIGLMTLKDIVVGSAVFQTLAGPPLADYDPELIWKHAVLCNRLLGEMYEAVHDKKPPEDVAAIGLLHNVGELLMLKYFPQVLKRIGALREQYPDRDLLQLEKELLGADHAELGAYLLNWWNMPYPLVEAALYHNNPLAVLSPNRQNVVLLHIADYLARIEMGLKPVKALDREILAQSGLPAAFAEGRGLA
ncbi:MAG: HDOD domain-containing protein [Deltaproteobacteria bacterium]|nr:HDOD domain-containing protein [Deltaproteobacteria bacterium]